MKYMYLVQLSGFPVVNILSDISRWSGRRVKMMICDAIKQNESELENNNNSLFMLIVCLNFRAISH